MNDKKPFFDDIQVVAMKNERKRALNCMRIIIILDKDGKHGKAKHIQLMMFEERQGDYPH